MNSVCLKCGSSLVHLAMTSTPLKLVGRLISPELYGDNYPRLMLIKQPGVTIYYAPALFRLAIELQLGLQSLPLPHTMVDNSILAYWFGSDMAIRVLFLLLACITITTTTTTNFTSSHTSTSTSTIAFNAKIGLVET
ncbi:hypothetical protein CFP56_004909 [Quercus suber]|uniref:Uncharacterized protein n=1 Tax=Quercus suber TaxID=58331 RepID=A0AAW0LBP1_QUESU